MMRVGEDSDGEGAEARVCVLGSTKVGNEAVTARQRSLLAALALAGRRGAAIEELADAVWAGRPPTAARSSLQNQMTRLRRAQGEDLIVCERATYWLGRATDVESFEQQIARAHGLPIAPAAIQLLSGALAMWRGLPYQDLSDSHAAEVERTRLIEQRGNAAELLATARVTIGDHDRAVAELRVEIEIDPFRDRVWKLLFVALQRAGRPGEALAAHRDHVRRLRLELDADPSPHLIDLGLDLSRGKPLDLDGTETSGAPDPIAPAVQWGHSRRHNRCQIRRSRPARPSS